MSDPPSDIDALVADGRARLRQGDRAGAAAVFEKVLARDPDHLNALVPLSAALFGLGRYAEAEMRSRQALAIQPDQYAAVRNLGVVLQTLGRHEDAVAFADGLLAVYPRHPQGLYARGNALHSLGRLEEAARDFEVAAGLDETRYEALTKLGLVYSAMPRFEAARDAMDRAIALRPDQSVGYYRRSTIRLLLRDFAGGWSDYEHRWRTDSFVASSHGAVSPHLIPRLSSPAGPGEVAGRRVLILAEQGVGDEMMFASMVPDVARDAAAVTLVCEPRLMRLFSASFPGVEVLPSGVDLPNRFDLILAAGSLGRIYRNAAQDFPGSAYLRPRAEVAAAWAERLGPRRKRLRIGVSWRGGTAANRGQSRSIALDELRPVLSLPDAEFISLQYGDPSADLAAFDATTDNPIRAFPRQDIDDFEELAGLVANLDLVVSVQTALVHLCGATGQTCLTLIPQNPEWRYAAEGASMPWYNSVRLFRQTQPGDWAPVVAEVADAVRFIGDAQRAKTDPVDSGAQPFGGLEQA